MSKTSEHCDWPRCRNKAFCATGNAGCALVCRRHFQITNGKTYEQLNSRELCAIQHMIVIAKARSILELVA